MRERRHEQRQELSIAIIVKNAWNAKFLHASKSFHTYQAGYTKTSAATYKEYDDLNLE